MARRFGIDNGSDFNFESDGLPEDAGPIPTDAGGGQIGGGTGWDTGASAPSSAPDGYHWDDNFAMFQPDAPAAPVWNPGGDGGVPPTAQPVDPTVIAPNIFSSGGNGGGGGITVDAVRSPDPTVTLPPRGPDPVDSNGLRLGGSPNGTAWVSDGNGSWMPPPATWPAGYHWDVNYAAYLPNAPAGGTGTGITTKPVPTTNGGIPAAGRTSDDGAILAQIGIWAKMPGADPSLAADPNYWLGRIKTLGGLGQDNLQFWQDASVGDSAFFRNPNRESGGSTSTTTTSGTAAGTAANPNTASLLAQIQALLTAPNTTASHNPAPNGAGLPLDPVLNQIGQTPFDQTMDASLEDLLTHGGSSPFGRTIEATLSDLIARGGITPNTTAQLTQARDANAGAMQGQTADARAALAARGLASPHGSPQGAETSAIGRISQSLAPSYASAVTDINTHAMDVSNQNVMGALTMATGLSQSDATTILNAVGTGTARQTALANIALKTLEDNMQWNEFLANFGLQKDQVTEELAQGRIASLVPLLSLFLQMSGASAQGFIGKNS